ncbi:MAG: preprotein translocase subunit SecA [Burkholderiales bacterium]
MYNAKALFPPVRRHYPERDEEPANGWFERTEAALTSYVDRFQHSRQAQLKKLVRRVAIHDDEFSSMDLSRLGEVAREMRRALRRDGFVLDSVARSFALVRAVSYLTIGMRHFDSQLIGGWILLKGMVAEMNTGEGKTLTATLPACTAALAGLPVHIVTVNDYLVERDAAQMQPIYNALGLSVGTVLETQDADTRRRAYLSDVTYVTNKILVFDYLRDRISLGQTGTDLHLALERLYGGKGRARQLLLRGLSYAIVDEADSVLVDEARTPLIISAPAKMGDEALIAQQGIELAKGLSASDDYVLFEAERRVVLTDSGKQRLDRLGDELGGIWRGLMRREELATQAIAALHFYRRDEQYLVRDGKVQIVDEYTGRVMADRSWQRGLHQLIEAKEGCEITGQKEPLARISYQRFFRRYMLLSGMTGTGSEVASEFTAVYGLAVARVPTHRPIQRRTLPYKIFAKEEDKWRAIAQATRDQHVRGRPVLLGTRSVAASEQASRYLDELGLPHRILNAKQDEEEADIVSRAGEPGCITVATNMAGRGTDIKLADSVAQAGGLHVILSERHDSARIDRQLEGRCGRQGDPGSFEQILSLEGPLLASFGQALRRVIVYFVGRLGPVCGRWLGMAAIRYAQRVTEKMHSRERKMLLKMDRQLGKTLSFSGRPE